MYGSTTSDSTSVHYSILQDNSADTSQHDEITFVENSNSSEDSPMFKSSLKPSALGPNRKISTISIISMTTSEKEMKGSQPPPIEFESEKRTGILSSNVLKTKRFFELYKLRTYLSFLENLVPKMDQVKEKIEEFCNENEDDPDLELAENEEFFQFTSKVDEEIETVSKEFHDFQDSKSKLAVHMESLSKELCSIENLMKNVFSSQYYDKEFLEIERYIRKLYLPSSLTLNDPPHFDKCLDFILDSSSPLKGSIRFKSMAFEALVQTMENTGNLFKTNAEIIRLAHHVRNFETQVDNDSQLKKIFSDGVQNLIWSGADEYFPIFITYLGTAMNQGYLQASDQIQGYVRLTENIEGDENLWKFIPIPETQGHYFYIQNKKYENMLGLRRDGPEYRQVHHRPAQAGYFNQYWQVMVDHQDKFVIKNRAHFDLVLSSNGASNVLPSCFTQDWLQSWNIC